MSSAEIVEITSKTETKNSKDNIKWTGQVLERNMKKCHKLKNSVKRFRKRSLAIFSYKKIKQKIEKTENLISLRIHKHKSLRDPYMATSAHRSESKPQKLQRSPFEWTTNSLFKYPLRSIEWETTAVTAAQFS